MKTIQSKLQLLAVVMFYLIACNSKKENKIDQYAIRKKEFKEIIKSPFHNINVPYSTYLIRPNIDTNIKVSSGTTIHISAMSLTDSSGQAFNELVELSYREFMNLSEIMAAGIPMMYSDEASQIKKPFQSAGMFELLAKTESGKKVLINDQSPIKVELASNINGDYYSDFYLNNKTGEWVYSGEADKEVNVSKIKLNNQLKKLIEIKAFLGKDFFVMDGDNLLDIYLNDNYEKITPYLDNPNKPLPKGLLKYGVKSVDVNCYDNVILNNNDLSAELLVWENINHVAFPEWTKNKRAQLKAMDNKAYEIYVNDKKNKTLKFKAIIKPIMRIKSLFKYNPDIWSKNYEETIQEINNQEEILATMKDVVRTLKVNAFGIYNCDKFYSNPEYFNVIADFELPDNYRNFIPEKVYYVSKKDKIIVEYDFKDGTKIGLYSDPSAAIYTVLEDNLLAVISCEELLKYNKEKHNNTSIKLNFKPKGKVSSIDDIKKNIEI